MESILTSIKKLLGIAEEYIQFDMDLIMHINSTLFILTQLGVGPPDGFAIKDASAVWSDFIGESKIELVKSYTYLKAKLMFDPPSSSSVIEAINRQISEFEWRVMVEVDPIETTSEEGNQNGEL